VIVGLNGPRLLRVRTWGTAHLGHSAAGIAWTAVTAAVMFTLAAEKSRTGRALDNPVLRTEAGSPRSTASWPGAERGGRRGPSG
jgi:hypothetical protein